MSTIDQLVSSDLAALGRETRGHVPALSAMVPDETVRRDNATLLELANAYTDGVAWTAWGIVVVACVGTTLAMLVADLALSHWVPRHVGMDYHSWAWSTFGNWGWGWLGDFNDLRHAVWPLAFAAVGAGAVRRYAMTRFTGLVDNSLDPIGAARFLVRRVTTWRAALRTSGLTTFGMFYGTLFAFDISRIPEAPSWDEFVLRSHRFLPLDADYAFFVARVRDLCVAIPAIVAVSIWIARRRPQVLRSRWVGVGAIVVLALAFGFARGQLTSWHGWNFEPMEPPSEPLRTVVTAVGALALLVAIASSSLRRSAPEERTRA